MQQMKKESKESIKDELKDLLHMMEVDIDGTFENYIDLVKQGYPHVLDYETWYFGFCDELQYIEPGLYYSLDGDDFDWLFSSGLELFEETYEAYSESNPSVSMRFSKEETLYGTSWKVYFGDE